MNLGNHQADPTGGLFEQKRQRPNIQIPNPKNLPKWFLCFVFLVMGYAWGQANLPDPEIVPKVEVVEVPAPSQPPVRIVEPTYPAACMNATDLMFAMRTDLETIMGAGGIQWDISSRAKTAAMSENYRGIVAEQNRQNKLITEIAKARLEIQQRYDKLVAQYASCKTALG